MDDNRLTKNICKCDIQQDGPWTADMCDVFCKYGFEQFFSRQEKVDIVTLKEKVIHKVKHNHWADEIWSKPKLRTYCQIK